LYYASPNVIRVIK